MLNLYEGIKHTRFTLKKENFANLPDAVFRSFVVLCKGDITMRSGERAPGEILAGLGPWSVDPCACSPVNGPTGARTNVSRSASTYRLKPEVLA